MTNRPVIGISTYRQPADWGTWTRVSADLLPSSYADSVRDAGGVPVLIPPTGSLAEARAVMARLDGLIVAGGADLNPGLYAQQADPTVTTWYDDRDASEMWLLDAADEQQKPVLGICRGMQLMAVRAGGTLVQHLPDVVGHDRHSGGDNAYSSSEVTVEPGLRISALVASHLAVPCHHHQAVAAHPGFVVTAQSADGVIEAMESTGERFELAVQWHPETDADKALFAGLIAAATPA
ncbi:gamma-glutamyl-gamma-aminobutyrate hydrolase family protein [Glaciibacter psychrotolerans]|uniref:Putative glutamine amidotransferase n=1 Tax=Glaciibacter psychrotolerans TaxID=670054 RepID=A0A7Z0EFK2_9MICO|nr:putative glutamine amidotransferase [Leifsonia psychrotolerans]